MAETSIVDREKRVSSHRPFHRFSDYGSGNADGNQHTHVNLPILLAGGGGGTLTPGRHVKFGGKPMSNLFLSMADRFGVKGLARFGDSTGRVEGI